MHMICSAYGQNGIDQGIVIFDQDKVNKQVINLSGKANMVIETDSFLITSVQEKNRYYLEFYADQKRFDRIETTYFYSYGHFSNGYLLLASFNDGIDSTYHLETKKWCHHKHHRDGFVRNGRSHYIQKIKEKIISIDNAYQQIYCYEDDELKKFTVINFDEFINLRLASYDLDKNELYINTEVSNEVIVLNLDTLKECYRIKLSDNKQVFSGGHSYDAVHKKLFISMRKEDCIYVQDTTNQL